MAALHPSHRNDTRARGVCDGRRRAMRKFSAIFWIKKHRRSKFRKQGGAALRQEGRWCWRQFFLFKRDCWERNPHSDRTPPPPQGSVGNEGNAVKLCRTGRPLCSNCMLGIYIISVNMLCFLFPENGNTVGRTSGARQQATVFSTAGVKSLQTGKVNTLCHGWIF